MDAHLVLLYLGLLKQDNYKEQVDSTSFYKLLGLESNATSQEVEAKYKFLKEKMKPETYPGFSDNKERFEYLISRIDRGYSEYISGKGSLEDVVETFEYVPFDFISEGQKNVDEFTPPSYVPYSEAKKNVPFDFISAGPKNVDEFTPPPYVPYSVAKKNVPFDFISEGPKDGVVEESEIGIREIYGPDDIFKAADVTQERNLLIPSEQLDSLSDQILETVVDNVLKGVPIKDSQMISDVSEIIRNYSKKRFDASKK